MKKTLFILFAMLFSLTLAACTAEEIPDAAMSRLKEHCYINPDGGQFLHANQNCRTVQDQYLPLTEIEFSEELLTQYSVCQVCTMDDQTSEVSVEPAEPTFVISEEELIAITAQWAQKYGDPRMWDYRVNAAFVAEVGTLPDMCYVFDRSLLPVLPDDDAISAEEMAEKAVSLAASYGSRLTEADLTNMQVIISQYRKPDQDNYLFLTTGSWLVSFWDHDETIAWMYVDAHTGIPNFFRIVPDGIVYDGEPGTQGLPDN